MHGLLAATCASLALSGCTGPLATAPAVVTVTDTAWQPPATSHHAPPAPAAVSTADTAATGAGDGAQSPAGSTIVVGRPTGSDPENPDSGGPKPVPGSGGDAASGSTTAAGGHSGRSTDRQTATGRAATTPQGATRTPPGSLSTDGNLIAAATSAAAAAGVSPANPDTPGPGTGPACPANPKYVNEATSGLRTDVAAAWTAAVAAGRRAGITLCLNDGKRSRAQQQAQFDEYAEEYGDQVADQLVLQPNKSAHVVGIAVDAQPADGYRWLQATRGSLGFCRIYDNEPWHFEFNPAYRRTGCPARLPEPER